MEKAERIQQRALIKRAFRQIGDEGLQRITQARKLLRDGGIYSHKGKYG